MKNRKCEPFIKLAYKAHIGRSLGFVRKRGRKCFLISLLDDQRIIVANTVYAIDSDVDRFIRLNHK